MSSLKKGGSTTRWRKIRERILRRDDYTCQHCGQYGNTVDHIVPRSMGGDDHWENLQTLCAKCNYSKGGRFFERTPTPPTPLVPDFPKNGQIVHYKD